MMRERSGPGENEGGSGGKDRKKYWKAWQVNDGARLMRGRDTGRVRGRTEPGKEMVIKVEHGVVA